jgi:hypothetical protein
MKIELQVPDDIAEILSGQNADLPRAALEALALECYRSNRLSDGRLRQLLGFATRMDVHAFLKEHGVYLNYSLADLEQDRQSSRDLESTSALGDSHAA